MKSVILSFNPNEYTVTLDPDTKCDFLTFSSFEEQGESIVEWVGQQTSPAPTRKTRKPSPLGKYIYEAKGKYCVRVWDGEAHNYGTVDTLNEALAIRDLALKNHHPHLLEKLY
ncbi:hypothetical protein NIES2109_22670 [Nostoc sp. HK-01]|nr:hypothetical protein NIES2109_22670 [Nostoc sp. HK-01]